MVFFFNKYIEKMKTSENVLVAVISWNKKHVKIPVSVINGVKVKINVDKKIFIKSN